MNTRKFLSFTFAVAVLITGLVAHATPSHATYYCNAWGPKGNVCHWEP